MSALHFDEAGLDAGLEQLAHVFVDRLLFVQIQRGELGEKLEALDSQVRVARVDVLHQSWQNELENLFSGKTCV